MKMRATVSPSDPVNYLRAVWALTSDRQKMAVMRGVLFRSQDATARAIAHENDQHPALFRTARRCVWEGRSA